MTRAILAAVLLTACTPVCLDAPDAGTPSPTCDGGTMSLAGSLAESLSDPPAPESTPAYLWLGQSNTLGARQLPQGYGTPLERVQLSFPDDSGAGWDWRPLAPRLSLGPNGGEWWAYPPWLPFGRALRDDRAAIWVYGVGGAPISTFLPGHPAGGTIGDLYRASRDAFDGVLDPRALVWVQGEADAATAEDAAAYQQRLGELVAYVRAFTGKPELPAVIVQLHWQCAKPFTAEVRAAQQAWVAGDTHAVILDVDGYALSADDSIHHSTDMVTGLGLDAAEVMR